MVRWRNDEPKALIWSTTGWRIDNSKKILIYLTILLHSPVPPLDQVADLEITRGRVRGGGVPLARDDQKVSEFEKNHFDPLELQKSFLEKLSKLASTKKLFWGELFSGTLFVEFKWQSCDDWTWAERELGNGIGCCSLSINIVPMLCT